MIVKVRQISPARNRRSAGTRGGHREVLEPVCEGVSWTLIPSKSAQAGSRNPLRDKPPFATHNFHAVAYVRVPCARETLVEESRPGATCRRLEHIEKLPRVFF